ncbi:MAG: putative bicarbonate transporter, IctB family [Leptolyngbyaceae cyanobacterium SM1_1_3]|nr:putative bicarbonate transporter, IctB family [Leptolyngbyaceae cyanobacterium SM1_1_3]NJN01702.1 putative bicarbonate transporter, IctB family [Leptolyngbyaceae cyanobacterium RM1_1_2]NJO11796.1 putative bicarbonate transporter, IctB family [Leptolyngbyaceae cyanobacterium SL_1_1]
MINSVWQRVTFGGFALHQWREVSYLHRFLSPFRQWRQSSWLLQQADGLGLLLVALIFALAPYVSTALIGVLLVACGSFWLLLTVSDEAGDGLTPVHLAVVLYWSVMVVATALSPVKVAALKGLIKLTLNLLLFLLMARVLRRPQLRTSLISVYLLSALVVSVYGLRQWFFGAEALATWVDPTSALAGTTRVYSYLGNPNLLAAYLIPAVMLSAAAIFVWPRWLPKVLAALMLGVNTVCLILTFSRGGWIGFVAAGFVLLMLLVYWWSIHFGPFWRRWALPAFVGGAAAFLVLAVLALEPLRSRVASIFVGRQDSSNNFRLNVWAAVIDMIRDRPILGIGPGNEAFNKIYPLYQRPRYTALSAYSVFLETAVEAGLVGFCAFLWLLVVSLTQGLTQLRRLRQRDDGQGYWLMAAIATQIGLLMHGLVDTVWYRPQVSTLWWLMMALVASYYVISSAKT